MRGFPALLFVGSVVDRRVLGFDVDTTYSMSVHLCDGVAAPIVDDALSRSGYVAEFGEEKSGQGLNTRLAGKLPVKLVTEIAQRG